MPNPGSQTYTDHQVTAMRLIDDISPGADFWPQFETALQAVKSGQLTTGCLVQVERGKLIANASNVRAGYKAG